MLDPAVLVLQVLVLAFFGAVRNSLGSLIVHRIVYVFAQLVVHGSACTIFQREFDSTGAAILALKAARLLPSEQLAALQALHATANLAKHACFTRPVDLRALPSRPQRTRRVRHYRPALRRISLHDALFPEPAGAHDLWHDCVDVVENSASEITEKTDTSIPKSGIVADPPDDYLTDQLVDAHSLPADTTETVGVSRPLLCDFDFACLSQASSASLPFQPTKPAAHGAEGLHLAAGHARLADVPLPLNSGADDARLADVPLPLNSGARPVAVPLPSKPSRVTRVKRPSRPPIPIRSRDPRCFPETDDEFELNAKLDAAAHAEPSSVPRCHLHRHYAGDSHGCRACMRHSDALMAQVNWV